MHAKLLYTSLACAIYSCVTLNSAVAESPTARDLERMRAAISEAYDLTGAALVRAYEQGATVTEVTEEEMKAEARKLLERLFEQANTDYKLYNPADWIELFKDISALVGSFDSKFHDLENNQKLFSFRGTTMTGSDLNYYFMGVFFSAYGWPIITLHTAMKIWKKQTYGGSPSANALWAADEGYSDGVLLQYDGEVSDVKDGGWPPTTSVDRDGRDDRGGGGSDGGSGNPGGGDVPGGDAPPGH